MYQPTKIAAAKIFTCTKPWIDKEAGLAIMKGSRVELIEKEGEHLFLIEVIDGIMEGLQMPFTAVQLAEHFEL
jgi:hypothetical protein